MRNFKFEIEITHEQGTGDFCSPLTNTPFGYEITNDCGEVVKSWHRAFGSYNSALEFAQREWKQNWGC